ncbi:MAG: N-acetyltransferase [Pirellulaceae bacterium]
MSDDLEIRAPTLHDASRLAALGRDTFIETFGHLYPQADLDRHLEQVYSLQAIEQELRDPNLTFQVIDDGRELVGFVKVGEVHVPVNERSQRAMELRQLYVRQRLIGRGLGTKLMAWADTEFTRCQTDEVYVSVFSENSRAIAFYQKYGFEKIGEYGYRVGDQVDREWIMFKKYGDMR